MMQAHRYVDEKEPDMLEQQLIMRSAPDMLMVNTEQGSTNRTPTSVPSFGWNLIAIYILAIAML